MPKLVHVYFLNSILFMAYQNNMHALCLTRQFRRSRSLGNGGLIRCAGLPSCPQYEQGQCGGHVNRLYIRECYGVCACMPPCRNRVVQAGVQKQLEVHRLAPPSATLVVLLWVHCIHSFMSFENVI